MVLLEIINPVYKGVDSLAREKSLSDIDKRIEELKKQKEKVVTDMAIGFAKKVINEQQISTKRELNAWYEKATEAIKFYDDFQEQSEKSESDNVLV